eukprot:Gb_10488 [translate_table: standard]
MSSKLRIKSKSFEIIKPSVPTPFHLRHYHLSSCDQVNEGYYLRHLYFYQCKSCDLHGMFMNASNLKISLREALKYFYPASGRFRVSGERQRLYIDCNDAGAEFYEVEIEATLRSIGDFKPNPVHQQLMPRSTSKHLEDVPILLVQVSAYIHLFYFPFFLLSIPYWKTKFLQQLQGKDFFIVRSFERNYPLKTTCCSLGNFGDFIFFFFFKKFSFIHGEKIGDHSAADTDAFCHFMSCWTELARGEKLSVAPYLDRSVISARDPPIPIVALENRPNALSSGTHPSAVRPRAFTFSRESINALKHVVGLEGRIQKPSSFECVSALLWRCISRARGIESQNEVKVCIPVNGRKRVNPHIPEGFFGCCVFDAYAKSTAVDVLGRSLDCVVECIREAVGRMNESCIRSEIDWIESCGMPFPSLRIETESFSGNDVCISSCWRYPVYETDFGEGKPVWVTSPIAVTDGLVFLLPTSDGGGIEALVNLREDFMTKLEADNDFVSFVKF